MGSVLRVVISDCPIGRVVHTPHEFRKGFFFTKHSCMGYSQRWLEMDAILKAGSEGTLTDEQAQAYLAKWGTR